MFADGRTVWGQGFGAEGEAVGELCFNTAMTGYQEVMTDPSYAKQVIAFTFPHIGNVGANDEDVEAGEAHALGCLVREVVTEPSNYRANQGFADWMAKWGRIGIAGRRYARADQAGARAKGRRTSRSRIARRASSISRSCSRWRRTGRGSRAWTSPRRSAGLQVERWTGGKWAWGQGIEGFGALAPAPRRAREPPARRRGRLWQQAQHLPQCWLRPGARVTVVPASASFDEIMAHEPDGFFLSNGPGDPAATGEYAVPVIQQMLETKKPLFGICLGHQMLALAVGGRTSKMFQGHRGANHPVKRLADGRVEITSMNHGFAVEREGMPDNVRETHVSLFDGSNCGIELTDRPAFSVQYHPEASPGPQDSFYLFEKFVGAMK